MKTQSVNEKIRENEEWWRRLFDIINPHFGLKCSKLCVDLNHPKRELTSKEIGAMLGINKRNANWRCNWYKVPRRRISVTVMRKNGRKMTTFENLYSFSVPSPSVDDGVE